MRSCFNRSIMYTCILRDIFVSINLFSIRHYVLPNIKLAKPIDTQRRQGTGISGIYGYNSKEK
ncbi:hypothetical protein BDA99DRAFT_207671 [Phascolomyces articulosus]|uniref:Uncharacterized protein n=1 Tax=Phascolomyces articulosus TaxID=60185 RepID=A0AAD5JQY7_9FUNG|nr:hypothetical protein BDA99DRAFT_207671 [Phascolomyces articulosus]